MDINIILSVFNGRKKDVADAFGVSAPAVSRWVRQGVVPPAQVMRLQLGFVKLPAGYSVRHIRKLMQEQPLRSKRL
jgi:DNA-binding transcriptional MerR regulator